MKSLVLLFALVVFTGKTLHAQQPVVFAPDNIALKGYDVVSFFNGDDPVKGQDSLTTEWNKVTWKFSSRAHLDSFKKAPEQYMPAYGGYCAYGMSKGYKAPTQADTWFLQDGRLYFNYNKEVQVTWNKNRDSLIEKADKNWPDAMKK
ncbi:MAG: YHS domain-containing (seleno)protein [Agriterribacter sp.]